MPRPHLGNKKFSFFLFYFLVFTKVSTNISEKVFLSAKFFPLFSFMPKSRLFERFHKGRDEFAAVSGSAKSFSHVCVMYVIFLL